MDRSLNVNKPSRGGGWRQDQTSQLQRFESKVSPEPNCGCWLWTGRTNDDGYGRVTILKKVFPAHRMAWTFYRGVIPDEVHVLHRCDVRTCVNPDHLWLGSQTDNIRDMDIKNRRRPASGIENGKSKFTVSEVLNIRSKRLSAREFATLYHVDRSTIYRVWRGVTWQTP